jgi:hypothetical protein
MLTEETLPVELTELNCASGCAKAVYKTLIKRDGVVIHTEYRYEDVPVSGMQDEVDQVIAAADKAIKARKEMESNDAV